MPQREQATFAADAAKLTGHLFLPDTQNKLSGDAAKAYSKKTWSTLASKNDLSIGGPVPFVPPKKWNVSRPRVKGGGFEDRYGNVWKKATEGKAEWDVRIPKGKAFEIFSGSQNQGKDYSHANISYEGHVTH